MSIRTTSIVFVNFLFSIFCIAEESSKNIDSFTHSASIISSKLNDNIELDMNSVDLVEDINYRNFQRLGLNPREIDPNIIQDSFLKTHELIAKYGYPAEKHKVETDDGYILEIHRIARPGAQPVLLMHGLLDSSSTWVVMGPEKGFGYMLYDLGYDVWLGNIRGNRYSRHHKTLDSDRDGHKFWDFSFHEIGIHDIPATIDYTLNATGFDKVHYVGHSQGSASFWVMACQKPEYNEKVLSMQALAPVAYIKHCKSPLVRIMSHFLDTTAIFLKFFGIHEFLPNNEILGLASQWFCKDESWTQAICSNIMFLICGFNPEQLNTTMLPILISHAPSGASIKQFVHFGQLKRSGHFRQYDYGWIKNLINYNSFQPPTYNLTKVTVKVALHYSRNDYISEPVDIEMLNSQLPNTIGMFLIPYSRFNHLDFVWGIDARIYLYERIVKIMKMIENSEVYNNQLN